MKGLLFAGDSYTWGQGLYYYSDLPRIQIPLPGHYVAKYVTEAHKRFKDTKRFARLVANHFDTFELTKDTNGGSDSDSLAFIDNTFSFNYKYEDISYLIFQTTQPYRSEFEFVYKDEYYSFQINSHTSLMDFQNNALNGWMDENNLTFDDISIMHKKKLFNDIKAKFIFLEDKGIKCRIMCWLSDYIPLIMTDEYMKSRLIPIKWNGQTFLNFQNLANKHKHFFISDDPYFTKSVGDSHIGLEGHKVIAENIIKNIEKDLYE
jgi:hypothetical protein